MTTDCNNTEHSPQVFLFEQDPKVTAPDGMLSNIHAVWQMFR